MATNWISDFKIDRGTIINGNNPEMFTILYHMFRCAGWFWLWECDGTNGIALGAEPNHVPDGNMEAAGVGNYTATGAVIQKVTSEVHEGYQSLEIEGASGDDVETDPLTFSIIGKSGNVAGIGGVAPNMILYKNNNENDFGDRLVGQSVIVTGATNPENDGAHTVISVTSVGSLTWSDADGIGGGFVDWRVTTPMHVAMWVKNDSGGGEQTWNVDIDPGTGTPVNVGSFGATSGWELKHFDIDVVGFGNITISIKPQGTTSTIYIDSIMVFRSFFEYAPGIEDHADGDTGAYVAQFASNEFESSNYTFVVGDIGKLLFLYDTSTYHPENTGCYEITGINVGRAVLDLRSATFSLSSQDGSTNGINWRMVDVYKWAPESGVYDQVNNGAEMYCGFALESPHSSKWRFVVRGGWSKNSSATSSATFMWAAPEDTDLDVQTGDFYPNGPSFTGANYSKTFKKKNWATELTALGGSNALEGVSHTRGRPGSSAVTSRMVMMFDTDGSYFMVTNVTSDENSTEAFMVGYAGMDSYHPGVEGFFILSPRGGDSAGGTYKKYIQWWDISAGNHPWAREGVGFGPDHLPREVAAGLLVYSSGGYNDLHHFKQANSQPNPFSGDEWLNPLLILRDPLGLEGSPSEREVSVGVYQGRDNMPNMSVFGNINGAGDSFAFASPVVTLTDAAGLFTADMVDKEVTVTNATSPGNDGTFTITGQTATTLTWDNVSGVAEVFTGEWSVNTASYIHIINGLCLDWRGERLV